MQRRSRKIGVTGTVVECTAVAAATTTVMLALQPSPGARVDSGVLYPVQHWPTMTLIHPTEQWQTTRVKLGNPTDFRVDENFYVVPTMVPGRP